MRELRRLGHVDRRWIRLAGVAGIAATTVALALTKSTEQAGAVVFLPWVALLAFELGAIAGLAVAAVALVLFLVPAALHGIDIDLVYVLSRAASFALIGGGVGLVGTRVREGERTTRTLVEGLPLVTYVESLERGLTYIGPQIEPITGYTVADWLEFPGLWRENLHADDADGVLAAYEVARAERTELEVEYRLC